MLQGMLMKLVLGFVAHEIMVAEGAIDWVKLESELEAALVKILPSFMEGEAVVLMKKALEVLQSIVGDKGVVIKVIELLTAKDFVGVLEYLKELIVGKVQPSLVAESVSYEQLAEHVKAA